MVATASALPLGSLRGALLAHPVYTRVRDLPSIQVFMQHHVFAVWDFMSLLKSLQGALTCSQVPWVPPNDIISARLVNEIVVGEECDEDGKGGYDSHFGLYLSAMRDVGADTSPVLRFIEALRRSVPLNVALARARVPRSAAAFVQTTLDIASHGKPHEVAAAFFYGREDVIPDMFRRVLAVMDSPAALRGLRYYLERHVEVDGDEHGPAAHRMLHRLCGTAPEAWQEANAAATRAIEARIAFWDGVVMAMNEAS